MVLLMELLTMDDMDGHSAASGASSISFGWMFRRAPGFFDVIAYRGTMSSGYFSGCSS